jgi:type IV pilus assembly protein PilM
LRQAANSDIILLSERRRKQMPAIPRVAKETAVIGLDIGTSLIKAVEMRATRGQLQLLNVAIRPTPAEVISNGVIVDAHTLGTAVRGLLGQHGFRTRAVVASVAGQSSLVVRPIEVPKMSRAELDDTMRWEVERHIPFAASEVVMDYQPLAEPEEIPESQPNMEVLLAVAQEDMVNAYIEVLRVAGLEARALDIEPLASCRSLIDMSAEDGSYDRTTALLNMGATTTDISVVRKGLLSFSRPIPLAGETLTAAIGEALKREPAEAERLKKELGRVALGAAAQAQPPPEAPSPPPAAPAPLIARVEGEGEEEEPKAVFDLSEELADQMPAPRREAGPQPQQAPEPEQAARLPETAEPRAALEDRVYQAIAPTLAEMVGEIRRSLEYFQSRYPDDRVERVVLFGGTALLPNLDRFLTNELALTVEIGNPLGYLSAMPAHLPAGYLRQIACLLPVAVGLALREMLE